MNMNKKLILFCAASLIAICVFLTDRGTTSKELDKTAQPVISTGAAVISSGGQTTPDGQATPDAQATPNGQAMADGQTTPDGQAATDSQASSNGQAQEAGQSAEPGQNDPDHIRENGAGKTGTSNDNQGNAGGTRRKKDSSGQGSGTASSRKNRSHRSADSGRSSASKATARPPKSKSPKSSKTSKPADQTTPAAAPSKAPFRPAATAEAKNQCTLQITCSSVLAHMDQLKENLKKIIPPDGVILDGTYEFSEGDTVFDLLKKVCSKQNILIDYVFTPGFSTYYIKGINQLYEFDCGDESGWMYSVNGKEPDVGCSQYKVKKNDNIVFYYTCER